MSAQHVPKTTGGRFLLFAVQCIVDRPEVVRVQEMQGSQTIVLEVMVDQPDNKRVVGQRGRTAEALRALLLNIGGKETRHYVLEILEPSHRSEEIPAPGWPDPPLPMPDRDDE